MIASLPNIKTSFINDANFPLVVEPENATISFQELKNLIRKHNSYFKELVQEHGALLFRNFPVENKDDFAEVIQTLGFGKFADYIGGDSPRKKLREGVYTSTEAPPYIRIPLHNELSYVKHYPSHIYFYCDVQPESGGETPIADARQVFQAINEDVRKRFTENKIRYVSCYHYKNAFMNFVNRFHKSWIDVFETDNKQEVERKCRENDIQFKWNKDDWIEISQVCPAVIEHPVTGETVWFNQAHIFDFNPRHLGFWPYLGTQLLYLRKHTKLHQVFFADGSEISQSDLYHIMDVLEHHSIYFPWQRRDLLVLDNVLAMHGRATFSGKRRILAAMTS